MSNRTSSLQDGFLPGLVAADHAGAYWLRQAMWRLRREVAWLWHERGWAGHEPPAGLPPTVDRLIASLDLARYAEQKQRFFEADVAASFLSELIAAPAPEAGDTVRGSFGWVVETLVLRDVEAFALALGLLPVIDCAAGNVIAACLNDTARTQPSLALVQRLWDEPSEVISLLNPAHPLARHGLWQSSPTAWDSQLSIAGPIAQCLLWPSADAGTRQSANAEGTADPLAVARLRAAETRGTARLMPLIAPRGTSLTEAAGALAEALDQPLLTPAFMPGQSPAPAATEAWLRGALLYLPIEAFTSDDSAIAWPLPALPITALIGMSDRTQLRRLPEAMCLPETVLLPSSYEERLALWRKELPEFNSAPILPEISRRFRYGPERITAICRDVRHLHGKPTADDLSAACRADIGLGTLAQLVTPRFIRDDLKLPSKQGALIDDLIHAMKQLTTVHYEWGTAKPWSEAGLSALFAGPPGTGKTMAAEVVAAELGLPLYRIDLSQVVNKYIGETEKNLRRLFDAAEECDVALFFDEADAIFGKRTEVRDSHDRYANLEISYLLERMERFKGLAILATNRRKDLDEAFMRRLRWVIDFELPGVEERFALWQRCLPDSTRVDSRSLNLPLLAERFALSGGHIRSIVLNACLRASHPGGEAILTMTDVLSAARHEYDKLGRTVDSSLFTA